MQTPETRTELRYQSPSGRQPFLFPRECFTALKAIQLALKCVRSGGDFFWFLACYIDKVYTLFTQPPRPVSLPQYEPSLSSLGVIDDVIAHNHGETVQMNDFWLGVEILSHRLMAYV